MASVKPWDHNFEQVLTDFENQSIPFRSLQTFSMVDIFSGCTLSEVIKYPSCQMSVLKYPVSISENPWAL